MYIHDHFCNIPSSDNFKPTYIQTDKQTNRQTDKQTNRQTDKQTNILQMANLPLKIKRDVHLPVLFPAVAIYVTCHSETVFILPDAILPAFILPDAILSAVILPDVVLPVVTLQMANLPLDIR